MRRQEISQGTQVFVNHSRPTDARRSNFALASIAHLFTDALKVILFVPAMLIFMVRIMLYPGLFDREE